MNKIKRFFAIKVIIFLLISLFSCNKSNLKTIKVAEVAHSVFYAPQYVALSLGYFEEEGLKIDLMNANGADKVTASLLSGDVQIGLQGPEPTIYLYKNDSSNYLINFAQLTTTDGSFIFGREKIDNFKLSDMVGKSILGGRAGGVPLMTLEYVLKQNGLTVSREKSSNTVNVRTDVQFGAMAGSFASGVGDFTTLFEPTATELLKLDNIYLLESVGRLAGEICYTAYSCTKKYLENNRDVIMKFVRAINKGLIYVDTHSDEEVAKILHEQFKESSIETLTSVVNRYRNIDAFAKTPVISENGFNRLQDIMIVAKELDTKVDINTLVNFDIAKTVVNENTNI